MLVLRFPDRREIVTPLTAEPIIIDTAPFANLRIDDPTFSNLHLKVYFEHDAYHICCTQGTHSLLHRRVKLVNALLSEHEPVYAINAAQRAITFTIRPTATGTGLGAQQNGQQPVYFQPDKAALTIGRDPSNDIVVDHPMVSRFHAEIEQLDSHTLLHDRGSANGTFANGHRVRGLHELSIGDTIQIGPATFSYQGTAITPSADQSAIRLDARDLTVRIGRKGKALLDGVSLTVKPCEFIALIGGSGAGKSTLLHCLAGITPPREGQVLYNDQDIYRSATAFGTQIAYVPQDDILHQDLTVAHALDFAAQLRLPPDTTEEERARRIDQALADVHMAPQRNQKIAKLSGGQRKRVSIAVELLANPAVLFLDEPTSGLDPGLDKAIMQLLRHLCDQGRTIVLVTHTTEHIDLCDLVAFLAAGRLVYYGPPSQAPAHFQVPRFSDIYAQVAEGPGADTAEIHFRQSPLYRTYVLERQASGPHPPGQFGGDSQDGSGRRQRLRAAPTRQWRILTKRYAELLRLDRVNLALLLAQTPIVACVLTLVTSNQLYTSSKVNNTQSVLLMLVLATLWFSLTNAAREIVKERPIYLRERLINLRLFPYVLSKASVLTVLGIVQVLALFWIVRLKTPHLPAQGIVLPAPVEMLISLGLCAVACLLLGLLISALVRTTDRAMTIVPIILIPQVIFSGAVFTLSGWTNALSYLTISHWTLAALGSTVRINDQAAQLYSSPTLVNVLHDNRIVDLTGGWPREMYADPNAAHLLGYWGALLLFGALFLAATYILLRRADTGSVVKNAEAVSRRTWLLILVPPVVVCALLALFSAATTSSSTAPSPPRQSSPSKQVQDPCEAPRVFCVSRGARPDIALPRIALNILHGQSMRLGVGLVEYLGANNPQANRNRKTACASDRQEREFGHVAHAPMSCDEYPFASTVQGGAHTVIAEVPIAENSKQGTMLSGFYGREFDFVGGAASKFTVLVVP
jgi:ABC-type multidrug transport system ATPase subunit